MVLVHAFGGSIPSSPATETVGLMTGFFRGYWSGIERDVHWTSPAPLLIKQKSLLYESEAKRTRRSPPPLVAETVGLMTGFFRGYWSGFELRYVATSVDQPASDEGND